MTNAAFADAGASAKSKIATQITAKPIGLYR
jgi:hypothetical protein